VQETRNKKKKTRKLKMIMNLRRVKRRKMRSQTLKKSLKRRKREREANPKAIVLWKKSNNKKK